MKPSLSIVLSTYEWPAALNAALAGLATQSDPDFDVVVADDGSGPATAEVVDRWRDVFGARLAHAWQPDDGFRLARVRDLGAVSAQGDYLVFLDGDCIPRRRFVSGLRRAAEPGWFLAGKRFQLTPELSRAVTEDRARLAGWSLGRLLLRTKSLRRGWVDLTPRDRRRPWRPQLPDFIPHDNTYGFLIGVARSDFEAVNGFDTRFVGWGDQDVDLAVRLRRLGLRTGWAGPRTTVLHLWHPSAMTSDRPTWDLLQETERSERTTAVEGIRELRASLS